MKLVELLAAYRQWYIAEYVPVLLEGPVDGMEDLVKCGWDDPLGALVRVDAADLARLEVEHGALPPPYVELLSEVGVGPLWAAYGEEPIPFHILKPIELAKSKAAAFSWLSAADATLARDKLGLDATRMLPFLVDDGRAFYAMLTRQHGGDDRVVLFDHAYEQGHPFGRMRTFRGFIERWVECARARKPLNPFVGL